MLISEDIWVSFDVSCLFAIGVKDLVLASENLNYLIASGLLGLILVGAKWVQFEMGVLHLNCSLDPELFDWTMILAHS